MNAGFVAAGALLVVAACAGDPDKPPAGDDPHGASEAGTAAGFEVEYGPWTVAEAPVLRRGASGAWDSGLVDPGAMIFHMGRFHMLYNGIPEWPHPLSVGWASSVDGRVWERQSPTPVFSPDPVPFAGWTVRATSVVVENGLWALYFSVGGEGRLDGVVGRATASSPEGPWSVDPIPALEPGGDGAWDGDAVGQAKVMPYAQGYVMYYTGSGAGPTRIGRAVSTDGIRWTKDPDPVFEPPVGEADRDSFQVDDPTVVRAPDGSWLMTYRLSTHTGRVALGLARSADGVEWTLDEGGPVTALEPPSPLSMIFYSNALTTHTDQFVYFEGESNGGTDVWLASRSVTLPDVP